MVGTSSFLNPLCRHCLRSALAFTGSDQVLTSSARHHARLTPFINPILLMYSNVAILIAPTEERVRFSVCAAKEEPSD